MWCTLKKTYEQVGVMTIKNANVFSSEIWYFLKDSINVEISSFSKVVMGISTWEYGLKYWIRFSFSCSKTNLNESFISINLFKVSDKTDAFNTSPNFK